MSGQKFKTELFFKIVDKVQKVIMIKYFQQNPVMIDD